MLLVRLTMCCELCSAKRQVDVRVRLESVNDNVHLVMAESLPVNDLNLPESERWTSRFDEWDKTCVYYCPNHNPF